MEDGHTLFDYSVGLNEIVQLMIKQPVPVSIEMDEKKESITHGGSAVTNGQTNCNGHESEEREHGNEGLENEQNAESGSAPTQEDQVHKVHMILKKTFEFQNQRFSPATGSS